MSTRAIPKILVSHRAIIRAYQAVTSDEQNPEVSAPVSRAGTQRTVITLRRGWVSASRAVIDPSHRPGTAPRSGHRTRSSEAEPGAGAACGGECPFLTQQDCRFGVTHVENNPQVTVAGSARHRLRSYCWKVYSLISPMQVTGCPANLVVESSAFAPGGARIGFLNGSEAPPASSLFLATAISIVKKRAKRADAHNSALVRSLPCRPRLKVGTRRTIEFRYFSMCRGASATGTFQFSHEAHLHCVHATSHRRRLPKLLTFRVP